MAGGRLTDQDVGRLKVPPLSRPGPDAEPSRSDIHESTPQGRFCVRPMMADLT